MNPTSQMIQSTSKTRTSAFHKALLTAGLLSGAAFTTLGFAAPANAASSFANLTDLLNQAGPTKPGVAS